MFKNLLRATRLVQSEARPLRALYRQACFRPNLHTQMMLRNYSAQGETYRDQSKLADDEVTCLMLHPVSWPNHGPNLELYLAEEAVGLVKSLNWQVSPGPNWQTLHSEDEELDEEEANEAGKHDEQTLER